MVLGLSGCPSKVPKEGHFPIKVIALTGDKVGIPGAKVSINKKYLGETDQFGTFVGRYRGKVKARVTIKVEGPGVNNVMVFTSRLRLKRTKLGLTPREIKVEAFLRAGSEVAGNAPPDPAVPGQADPATPPTTPPTKIAQKGAEPAVPPVAPSKAIPAPRRERKAPPALRPEKRRKVASIREPKRTDVPTKAFQAPRRAPLTPPSTPNPPILKLKGKYKITATSNVGGVRVYTSKKRRSLGTIRDAGGSLKFIHKDRSRQPGPLKVIFKVRGSAYKENSVTREVTIDPNQEEYSVEGTFEKRTPFRISVRANVAGAKVRMNGRSKGTISSPDTPLELEYVGKPRSIRIDVYPPRKLRKQKRHRESVKLVEGTYEYSVNAEFKLPSAEPTPPAAPLALNPKRRAPAPRRDVGAPPLPPSNLAPTPRRPTKVAIAPPAKRIDTPPPPRPSGIYKIMVSSNAPGTKIYKGRKMVGTIADAGGTLEIPHRDRRSRPRSLSLTARAPSGYTSSKQSKRVALMVGQESYQIQFEFSKRQPIQIMAKAKRGRGENSNERQSGWGGDERRTSRALGVSRQGTKRQGRLLRSWCKLQT